jgi:tripartite-type tricarboxylate transporter receptor subunit TctC
MSLWRSSAAVLALGAAAIVQPASAFAQSTFPSRPVHWIVPFPPGGSAEIISRVIANRLRVVWGQPVIIDNKPGAGTIIATDAIAKSAPDGHSFGLVVTGHVINPSLRKLPYDTLKDLAGVTQLVNLHLALIAHPSTPYGTVSELIAYSKANPGKLSFGTASGIGTSSHLFGELLNLTAGTSLVHVAYKGSSPLQTDLLGGQIPLMVDSLASQLQMVNAGKMKLIALTSSKRHPDFPYPLVAETVPGVSADSFFGLVIPSATPRGVVQKINRDLVDALAEPEVRERMKQLGLIPVGSSPGEFDAFIRDEVKRWAKVIEQSGVKIDG